MVSSLKMNLNFLIYLLVYLFVCMCALAYRSHSTHLEIQEQPPGICSLLLLHGLTLGLVSRAIIQGTVSPIQGTNVLDKCGPFPMYY